MFTTYGQNKACKCTHEFLHYTYGNLGMVREFFRSEIFQTFFDMMESV